MTVVPSCVLIGARTLVAHFGHFVRGAAREAVCGVHERAREVRVARNGLARRGAAGFIGNQ
eukprot:12107225-Alexandrium_andersonii.AAC.1